MTGRSSLPNQGLENGAAGQTELIFELPQHVRRCGSRGHGEVEEQEREHDAPEPEEEPAVQGQAGGEYLREAYFLEPQPVGVQGHGLPQSAHGHEQDEEPEPEAGPPASDRSSLGILRAMHRSKDLLPACHAGRALRGRPA